MHRIVLLALALVAGCSTVPWKPYEGWKTIRTKHVTLYTQGAAFRYTNALENLELMHGALASSLFQGKRIWPVEVLMLEESQMVSTIGRHRRGLTIARLPGVGALGRRGLIVIDERASTDDTAHRLAHLFVHAIAPNAPLWVHEAYATYLQSIAYKEGKGTRIACLGLLPPDQPRASLDELFTWSWSQYDSSNKTEWYGHAARNLIDYFLLAENGALRPKLGELLTRASAGEDARKVVSELLSGVTPTQLETRIADYRRDAESTGRARDASLCPIRFPIPDELAADPKEPRVTPADSKDMEELFKRLWMIPRRQGHVDWYPPQVITLEGLWKS